MIIKMIDLLKLPVFTRSGVKVGKISGFEFEAESQSIVRYEVRRSIISTPLLIHRTQVVSLDSEKVIVDDLSVPEDVKMKLVAKVQTQEGSVSLQSMVDENT